MLSETVISKGYQTVVPAKIRKTHHIMPGDVIEWVDDKKGIHVHIRKKRTLNDIIGIVKSEGDAVESKKFIQKGAR